MSNTRIGLGLAAWTLGILLPMLHHVLLHWPIALQPTSNVITRMENVFESLPWIDWVYFLAMAIVGVMLILSGFGHERRA